MPLFDGPPHDVADPRALLVGYLDWYREALLRKVDGLTEEQLRTGILGWSPLGLVEHLTGVERRWLQWGFLAEDVEAWPEGEWRADPPAAEILAAYAAAVRRSREIVADPPLDTPSAAGGRFPTEGEAPPLGRILFHLLQEYARHVGHLDIARQLIDGRTGE